MRSSCWEASEACWCHQMARRFTSTRPWLTRAPPATVASTGRFSFGARAESETARPSSRSRADLTMTRTEVIRQEQCGHDEGCGRRGHRPMPR
jgi:hypothetical protein